MNKTMRVKALFSLGLGALAAGCDGTAASSGASEGESRPVNYLHQGIGDTPVLNLGTHAPVKTGLGVRSNAGGVGLPDRSVDYGLALRTASLKLRGDLPTLAEIRKLQAAVAAGASDGGVNDPGKVYSDMVLGYINTPLTFNRQMVQYWRNQLRMGDTIKGFFGDSAAANMERGVNLETGPNLAARLVATDADMRKLFTQDRNNCPTFDPNTGVFTDGACFGAGPNVMVNGATLATMGNNVAEGQQAGILTNPGFMATYFSNMGFRRARVLQELFACTRYPAEFAAAPKQIGTTLYASPWPEFSVTSNERNNSPTWATRKVRGGGTTTSKDYVNFSLALGCQGCHTSLNRRAPMFAGFDQVGYYNPAQFMVPAPVTDSPWVQMQDYLPVGNQQLAWKFGANASNFLEFGQKMAADPQVQKCFVVRAWNQAYSRDDVVQELALVPESVVKDLADYFVAANGANFNFKKLLHRLYTDSNFIRF